MIALLFLFMNSQSSVRLKVNEPLTPHFMKGRFRSICPDGSFLLLEEVMALHFNADGRLINKLGQKGEGPGEFNFILTGIFDGNYYWFKDADPIITLYSKAGKFLIELPIRGGIQKIGYSGKSLYMFHLTPKPRPSPYLGLVEINGFEQVETLNSLTHFHPTSQEIIKFKYNNDNHWLIFHGGRLYVADEMTPKVQVYDLDYNYLREIKLLLPEYAPSPNTWVSYRGTTRLQRLEWFASWSRFVGFAVKESGMLIAYDVPVEDNPQITQTAVVQVDFDGKPMKRVIKYDADFMGTHGGFYYLFRIKDENVIPEYWVDAVPW